MTFIPSGGFGPATGTPIAGGLGPSLTVTILNNYTAIRDKIAEQLATLDTFLTVHATVPMSIVAPAAVVVPGNPIITPHESMDPGLVTYRFQIIAALQSQTEQYAQNQLDELITGATSVPTVVEADQKLNAATYTIQVTEAADYGVIDYAAQRYIGARFLVEATSS